MLLPYLTRISLFSKYFCMWTGIYIISWLKWINFRFLAWLYQLVEKSHFWWMELEWKISMLQLNKVEQRGVAGSPSGMGGSGGTENNQGDICTTFSPSPSHAASIGGIGIGIGWTIPTVNLVRAYFLSL